MNAATMSDLIESIPYVIQHMGCSSPADLDIPIGTRRARAQVLSFAEGTQLYLVDTGFWPECPPIAMMNWGDGRGAETLRLNWNAEKPPAERLVAALEEYIAPTAPRTLGYGMDIETASSHIEGWSPSSSMRRFLIKASSCDRASGWLDRLESNLSTALRQATITIVGLGSVGSFVAEQLTRSGIGHLNLIDHDAVEPANLSRTIYERRHIGLTKTDAAARTLLEINPGLSLSLYSQKLEEIEPHRLREIFTSSRLIVAATDNPRTQLNINRCSGFADKPSVYVGLYPRAHGGEIVTCVPKITPCFRCLVGRFRASSPQNPEGSIDYGTGRLRGEAALAADIHHVSCAATRMIVSLTAAMQGSPASLASHSIEALKKQLHMSIHSMESHYWFFPRHFANVTGQFAFQSVWVTGSSEPDCPVCGHTYEPDDPFVTSMRDFDATTLRPD
jgi:molybdopterin/thiamine biosynthesis adenylyltransferase